MAIDIPALIDKCYSGAVGSWTGHSAIHQILIDAVTVTTKPSVHVPFIKFPCIVL